MCNLYGITESQNVIRQTTRADRDTTGNRLPLSSVLPDSMAPIVRKALDGQRELVMARWGMPASQRGLLDAGSKRAQKRQAEDMPSRLDGLEPDSGLVNVRNTDSTHWKRWLGVEHRCVVPFTSFRASNRADGADIWFALDETRPLAFFAGIWTSWTSVRKTGEGETTNDLFGLLTTEPNAEVGAVYPETMPVILRTAYEIETWMAAPTRNALTLQQQLPDGTLKIVARGEMEDEAA